MCEYFTNNESSVCHEGHSSHASWENWSRGRARAHTNTHMTGINVMILLVGWKIGNEVLVSFTDDPTIQRMFLM